VTLDGYTPPPPAVDALVPPAGEVVCPAVDPAYGEWLAAAATEVMWERQGYEMGGMITPILGGVVPTPEGDWQIMGSAICQSTFVAAPLPLTIGGDFVILGGLSAADGSSWVWSPHLPVDSPWRTAHRDDLMRALGLTAACMTVAYS
jgi:hypothetical protein